MIEKVKKTFESWIKKYDPISVDGKPFVYPTSQRKEVKDILLEMNDNIPNGIGFRVWTIRKLDKKNSLIIPGFYVGDDKLGYYITMEKWNDENEIYKGKEK